MYNYTPKRQVAMKISIYLDCRQRPFTLRLAVTHHSQRALLSTGITLDKEQWDSDRQRVVRHPKRVHLQRAIDNIRRTAEDTAVELAAQGKLRSMSVTELRDRIRAAVSGEEYRRPSVMLLDRFRIFAAAKTNRRTHDIYANTAKVIRRMVGDIALDKINKQWLDTLDAILTRQGAAVNTRAIHFRNIRAVINDAIDNDLTTNYPFRRFTIRHEETAHRVLSLDELRDIFALRSWHADIFRLSFLLVGMNAADMYALTDENLQHGRIVYRRQKTGRIISIRLEPEALSIIERNRGVQTLIDIADRYASVHNFTDSMSKYLRRHHPSCTFYYARHTWATLAFSLGISMDTISRALGHSFSTGARVTAVYVQAENADIDAANRKVIDYTIGRR